MGKKDAFIQRDLNKSGTFLINSFCHGRVGENYLYVAVYVNFE